jgi:hypothetical protein
MKVGQVGNLYKRIYEVRQRRKHNVRTLTLAHLQGT